MYTIKDHEFYIGKTLYKADFVPEVIISKVHKDEDPNFYEQNIEIQEIICVYKYLKTVGWQRTEFNYEEISNGILESIYINQYGKEWEKIIDQYINYNEEY